MKERLLYPKKQSLNCQDLVYLERLEMTHCGRSGVGKSRLQPTRVLLLTNNMDRFSYLVLLTAFTVIANERPKKF